MRTGHQAVPLVAQSAALCGILARDSAGVDRVTLSGLQLRPRHRQLK